MGFPGLVGFRGAAASRSAVVLAL
ncbi:ABC transporter, partial [Sinorhizobium meliloti]